MWGTNLRNWFELFSGMMVYRAGDPSTEQGWLSWQDIEKSFELGGKTFQGKKYDRSDQAQRNDMLDGIAKHANLLCEMKLLERRRLIVPPSLDYRVTRLGRFVDNWGYGPKPGFRKRAFFFGVEAFYRAKRYWKIFAVGAVGMVALNAIRFYGEVWQWISGSAFPVVSAAIVAAVLTAWHLLTRKS